MKRLTDWRLWCYWIGLIAVGAVADLWLEGIRVTVVSLTN